MKLKVGDQVVVIAGAHKGKQGKVTRTLKDKDRVVVEKVNLRTRHIKKRQNQPGEKIQFEAPIHCSNVMLVDPKDNKRTRIGAKKLSDGKKVRIAKRSGQELN